MDELTRIVESALADFSRSADAVALENAKAKYLGKAGALTGQLKILGKLAPSERAASGARINAAKAELEDALARRRAELAEAKLAAQLAADALDVSLPGRGRGIGGLHPLTITLERIETLFRSLGFAVADGPEIEDDFHNFTALNTPENHPARSMHDTFYVDGGMVLRTHTSPIQIRYMETHAPPIRIIAPGRVYRVDSDATHSPMFHQCEGLWIGANVSFKDLKFVFSDFLRQFFETDELQV
ncbi:MAG TPA: phenylalanine--tRNA ligase subunit alpha, partial [Casimicrobiaceae bacterium]|nr:phenylalanine--tRNA ligase subunit alpha [Casimicrobiaceae bacterium]